MYDSDYIKEQCSFNDCRKEIYVEQEKWDQYCSYFCNWKCEMWYQGIGGFIFLKLLSSFLYLLLGIIVLLVGYWLNNLSVHGLLIVIILILLSR